MKAVIKINENSLKSKINPEIYGHFSEHLGRCIYNGLFVGKDSTVPNTDGVRNDIIKALKDIKIPVLRWPGGCFADEYHWKDGVGFDRRKMVNTNWGGITEDNSFGTHEFMNLCEQLDCEPYIAGNLESGTVSELSEWVEYMTSDCSSPMTELRKRHGREKPWKLKYLGIGNESWGCGGNMRAEYYADEYRKYQTFCKNYAGNTLYKIACGPNADDYHWTETVMKNIGSNLTSGISLHYYTIPTSDWSHKGSSTQFDESEYYNTIKNTLYMKELIKKHSEIMDKYDADCKIGLIVDEWGCWYDCEPDTNPGFLFQQNTMRDAIVAAINLNIFNENSRRVKMANIAQAINVLQAVILTEGEQMMLTPTYHIFKMFNAHHGAQLAESVCDDITTGDSSHTIPAITQSASVNNDGVITCTPANCSYSESAEMTIECEKEIEAVNAEILFGEASAHNTFDEPENVMPKKLEVSVTGNKVLFTLPPCSAAVIRIKCKE